MRITDLQWATHGPESKTTGSVIQKSKFYALKVINEEFILSLYLSFIFRVTAIS